MIFWMRYVQARNRLGTPGGDSERGSIFLNYVQ